jgi:hypothetical protein
MVKVTARAGRILQAVLSATKAGKNCCLRLDLSGPGFSLDRIRPGDEVVSFGGRNVLALDPYTAETCGSCVLDWNEQSFVLANRWELEGC